MSFNENIKMTEKLVKTLINYFRTKLSMWHFVIEPVISYGKCIDVMCLNKNYLICIFMNINEIVNNRGKTREKIVAFARFWMGYKIYLASLGPIIMAASVVRQVSP